MTVDEALNFVEQLLQRRLDEAERAAFRAAWEGQTYDGRLGDIAKQSLGWSEGHIKNKGSELWRELSDRIKERINKRNLRDVLNRYATQPVQAQPAPKGYIDWGEAPDVSSFYGRSQELATLQQWIIGDRCRVVTVMGMGGMGKTALSVKITEQIQEQFEYVIWRSLRNTPPIQTLLTELILFLSNQQTVNQPDSLDEQLDCLMQYLKQHRCLLVLDNLESILQQGDQSRRYLEGYDGYGQLLRRASDERHQSCLLLTSREKPIGLSWREETEGVVRSQQLAGVCLPDGEAILAAKGLHSDDEEMLVDYYRGNPLALKIAATTIKSTFNGNIRAYLQHGITIFGDIHDLLDQQFDRLSDSEQQVMYWLAIHRECITFEDLQKSCLTPVSLRDLLESLESLQERSLIEVSKTGFTQQPVVMEYVTQKLIDVCCQEIISQTPNLLRNHGLLRVDTHDYIQDIQTRLILKPLAQRLLVTAFSQTTIEFLLNHLLELLRGKSLSYTGYAAGNIINLLNALQIDLSERDFSSLVIAQAHLANSTLQGTNFSGSTLYQSSFTEVFGGAISIAFSPDGTRLAVGDARCDIHLWQLHNQQKLLTLRGHTSWVFSLVFSPSGKTLVSASDDHVVKLWNTKTGECLQTLKGPTNILNAVTFSSNEESIVWSNEDLTIQLWNVEHPEQQIASLQGYTLLVRSTAFSPNGQTLAVSTQDQTIKLWNIQTGECTQTLSKETAVVRLLRFSSNGRYLASTSTDYQIQLWDIQTGQCLHVFQGHTQGVSEIVFSHNDRYLASSSFDRTVKVWDVATGQCVKTLCGHHKSLMACAFSPDGQYLASGGGDHAIKLWNLQTGQCLKTLQGYANGVAALAVNPNTSQKQQILASAYEDKTVKLWDLTTGAIIKTLPIQDDLIWGVAFIPGSGTILASANADRTIKLWNWQTGECLQTLRHQNWGWSVMFHPNGQLLASGSYDQTIKLWETDTGECLSTLQGHSSAVLSVAFSPNGKILASSSFDRTVRIWNVETGTCTWVLRGHCDRVWQAKFSADGQFLASCSYDKTVKLWNPHTGECLRTFVGHQEAVTSVDFTQCQQKLISGSYDKTIKIWDITTGECLQTLQGHNREILSLLSQPTRFSLGEELESIESVSVGDRESLIISSSLDGTIKVWHLETGNCVKTLIAPRPYERMNITDVSGITEAQRMTLKILGAIE